MTELNSALRSVMHDHADAAPSTIGLLHSVHQRSRRAARRRRLTFGGVAAAVVLLIAGTSTAFALQPDHDDGTLQIAAPTDSRNVAPPSPVDARVLPSGFQTPKVLLHGWNLWALTTERPNPHAALSIEIGATAPKGRTSPGTLKHLEVNGSAATLYTVPPHRTGAAPFTKPPEAGGPYAELIFKRKPNQWVRIEAWNGNGTVDMHLTQADLVRVASGLVERERPAIDLLRFRKVPSALEVCGDFSFEGASGATVSFCPQGDEQITPYPAPAEGTLRSPKGTLASVDVEPTSKNTTTDPLYLDHRAKRIRSGSRVGQILVVPGRTKGTQIWDGWIQLRKGYVAQVRTRETKLFTERAFAEFVAGITPGKDLTG